MFVYISGDAELFPRVTAAQLHHQVSPLSPAFHRMLSGSPVRLPTALCAVGKSSSSCTFMLDPRTYSSKAGQGGSAVLTDDPEINKQNYYGNYYKIFGMVHDGDSGGAMEDFPCTPAQPDSSSGTEQRLHSSEQRDAETDILTENRDVNKQEYYKNYYKLMTQNPDQGSKVSKWSGPLLTDDPEVNRDNYHSNYYKLMTLLMQDNDSVSSDGELTHVDSSGRASMVDVGWKVPSERVAVAGGQICLGPQAFDLVRNNQVKKGDVLTVAQLAGIMAAKKTASLVPLCHSVNVTKVDVRLELVAKSHSVYVEGEVHTVGQTGVEMEALTAVSVALLTVYDMCKAVTHDMVIDDIQLLSKTGGYRGDYSRA